jgi:hypothetical protein
LQIKPGMIVVTQGDPKSIISWGIRLATGSWWTHGFVCVSETEGIEAVPPRVRKLDIAERLAELTKHGQDYVILDLPGITDDQRVEVAKEVESYVGRMYDIWGCVYFLLFKSWVEGTKRVVCSRIMTACFYDAMGLRIFENAKTKLPASLQYRLENLLDGYCTPDEVLRYSELQEVNRVKA